MVGGCPTAGDSGQAPQDGGWEVGLLQTGVVEERAWSWPLCPELKLPRGWAGVCVGRGL